MSKHWLRSWGMDRVWPDSPGSGIVPMLAIWLGLLLEDDRKTAVWWWRHAVAILREPNP